MGSRSRDDFPTIIDALRARAEATPDQLAYVVEDVPTTYGELFSDALNYAQALASRGLQANDRCAVIMGTTIDTVRVIYGIQILGAAPAVLNTAYPAETLSRRIALLQPKCVIGESDTIAALSRLQAADKVRSTLVDVVALRETAETGWRPSSYPDPADTAFLQVTSGTSGEPKAAIVSHHNLAACLRVTARRLEIEPKDIFISWVPLHHEMGLARFTFFPAFVGCPAYLIAPKVTNFERWLRLIGEVGATITGSPDFGFRIAAKLVDPAAVDLSTLRYALNGGEPVRSSTIEEFESKFGCPGAIRPGYGLAESTLSVATVKPNAPIRIGRTGSVSCGPPLEGITINIQSDDGDWCAAGQVGNILIKGEVVFQGYLNDPVTSAETLRDGWLHTGDTGFLDEAGELHVLGRKRALIKRAGAVVAPRELEEAADLVDRVRFTTAIGIESDQWGRSEEVVMVAEVRADPTMDLETANRIAADINNAVRRAVGFRPADVMLVKPHTIPRTRNGKIRHAELRRLCQDGRLDPDAVLFTTATDFVYKPMA